MECGLVFRIAGSSRFKSPPGRGSNRDAIDPKGSFSETYGKYAAPRRSPGRTPPPPAQDVEGGSAPPGGVEADHAARQRLLRGGFRGLGSRLGLGGGLRGELGVEAEAEVGGRIGEGGEGREG